MEPKLNVERLDERAMPSGVPDPLLGTPLAGGPPAQTVPPTPRTPYETLTQTPLLLPDTTPVVPYVPDLGPPPPGSGNTFGPRPTVPPATPGDGGIWPGPPTPGGTAPAGPVTLYNFYLNDHFRIGLTGDLAWPNYPNGQPVVTGGIVIFGQY